MNRLDQARIDTARSVQTLMNQGLAGQEISTQSLKGILDGWIDDGDLDAARQAVQNCLLTHNSSRWAANNLVDALENQLEAQRNPGYDSNNRSYDNRGYDNRDYDNRGYDNRRYDNRGYDNRGWGPRPTYNPSTNAAPQWNQLNDGEKVAVGVLVALGIAALATRR